MSKKPSIKDSTNKAAPKRLVPKRQLSKWEKESRRRRIIGIIISVVIVGVLISGGIVAYVELIRPWHQPIVKVNDKTYDMDYFIKMLRVQRTVLEFRGYDMSQISEETQGQYVVGIIQTNELVRQKAEELSKESGVDITDITDEEINEKFLSWFGFDPDGEVSPEDYNEMINNSLENRDVSRGDFEKLEIIPIILSEKVREAMGNEKYPVAAKYDHVKVKAVLLGTEEEAEEVRRIWDGNFNHIIKEYSPSRYYPEDGYWYWLVMVTELPEDDEDCEEGDLYINAMLLATEKKAEEVIAEFNGNNFAELAEKYSLDSSAADGGVMGCFSSDEIEEKFGDLEAIQELGLNTLSEPISQNYPDDPVEWLPKGIEGSTVFDNYAFYDGLSQDEISTPIETTDGYWLVMVTEGDAEGEEGELYIKAILLDSEEKAEELKTQIEDGGDFAALAQENSLDSSAANGGDMGWMSQVDIESKFGAEGLAIVNGNVGSGVSEPKRDTTYTTSGGYWLVMVYKPEEEEEQEGEGKYIRAILLDSKEKAEELIAEIGDGGDFAILAQENSLDSSAADGGDMGWMSLDDIESKFGAGVLAIINDLSQDEISTPIETTDGYWLVMVTEGDAEGEEGELYIKAILLDSEEKAEELKTQIEDGGDFATLAQENSLDSSAANGGDMGWMSQVDIESKFGAGVLAIINGLSPDEGSGPYYDVDVSKQSGYWLVDVLGIEDRTLIDEHRDSYIDEYYSEWLNGDLETGKEEERIKDYLDDSKVSWAFDHI